MIWTLDCAFFLHSLFLICQLNNITKWSAIVWSCSQCGPVVNPHLLMKWERKNSNMHCFQYYISIVLNGCFFFSFFFSCVDFRMRCIMLNVFERLPSLDLDWKIGSHDWGFSCFSSVSSCGYWVNYSCVFLKPYLLIIIIFQIHSVVYIVCV
jgi:hypothetical protein